MSRRWLESIRKRFFPKQQSTRRPERKPDLSLELLEDRTVPATLTEAGTTLTINLDNGAEQVAIVSNGGTYGLTSNHNFVDGGLTAGRATGFGSTSGTVTAAGLAAYDTINIIDSAQNTRVTFNNSGANAYSDNFTVTLNDDTAFASGEVSVVFAGSSSFGVNNLTVTTTRNIQVGSSTKPATVTTSDGNIAFSANAAGTTSGPFDGVALDRGTVQATGSGTITMTGRGARGIRLQDSSRVQAGTGSITMTGIGSTVSGIEIAKSVVTTSATIAGQGNITLDGTGTTGVSLSDSSLSTVAGNIAVTGNASLNNGINVFADMSIKTSGTAPNAGNVTLTGTGGTNPTANSTGVSIGNFTSRVLEISTVDGDIKVVGQTPNGNAVSTAAGLIQSTGSGDVSLKGTASTSKGRSGVAVRNDVLTNSGKLNITGTSEVDVGVKIEGSGQRVGTTSGSISITGTSTSGDGVAISSKVSAANAAAIDIMGTTTSATKAGVVLSGSASKVTSATGPIDIMATGAGSVSLNAPVTSAGADITISADRDILGNASGAVSTGAAVGTINVIADQDNTGTPNDAGTIQLSGPITAGSGLGLHLTDTDGFINGTINSAGGLSKLGTGTVQLNAANTINGLKTVNAGTLLVNGSITGSGVMAVDTAGTLGGTGGIANKVLVLGTITGGTVGGVGTLTVGAMSFDGGTYRADAKNSTSDTIATSGAVDLQDTAQGNFILNYTGNNTPAGTVFTFINNTGSGAIVDPALTNAAEGGTVPIKARVGKYTYTGGTGNDFTLAVQQTADLQITKTGPASPVPGTEVTYTITVTNVGPDAAPDVAAADVLPAGTTFVSLAQDSGPAFTPFTPAVGSGGNVVLTTASLAAGASATFTMVVHVDPSLTGALSNTAQVATTITDSNPTNNMSTASGTLLPQADLQISKTGPATVVSGQNVTYSVTVTNAGASDAQTVAIADPLPAGTTFVSLAQDSGPAFTPFPPAVGSGGSVVLTSDTLAAGASATFTLVVNVGAAVSGPLSNTAQIASTTADPNTANNRSTVTTTALIPDDLQIHKSGPATVDPGANLTYTITVGNTGAADALNLVVADVIPANTTFVSLNQTSGTAFDNITTPAVGGTGNVVLDTATFAAGEIATFTLVVNVASGLTGGSISNTAQVTSITPDSDPTNNSSTAITAITQSDVQVTKNGPATVIAGEDVAYTITFSNSGPDDATNVVISDNIGLFTSFVSLTQNAGGAGFTTSTPTVGSNGTVTISTPHLAVGQVATFTLVVRTSPVLANGTISNTATATSLTPDTDSSNNSSTATTTVTTQADLQVSKTGPATVVAGQNATYTITVSNPGPSNALDVSISDALPTGTTFVSLTQNSGPSFTPTTPGVGSNGTVTLDATSMSAGATATFTLVVKLDLNFTGTLDNTATGTTSTAELDTANNTSTASATVTPLQLFVVGEGDAGQGRVRAYRPGDPSHTTVFELTPYPGFTGAIRVATGDVTGDGFDDIIAGTSDGPVSRVKVFDGTTGLQVPGPIGDFRPFGSNWKGGVFVAAGDVDLDGRAEIFVTQGRTGNLVRVYDGSSGQRLKSFQAFGSYNGGLTVAAGDVDSDGRADVIVGQRGGPGKVRTFDVAGGSQQKLNTFDGFSGGVFVAAGDMTGDANAEIIVGRRANLPHIVKVMDGNTGNTLGSATPFPGNFQHGLRVGTIDADGDGKVEVLVGAGPDVMGPQVKLLKGLTLTELDAFFAYDPQFQGGVLVG